jgi:hypothetical protein
MENKVPYPGKRLSLLPVMAFLADDIGPHPTEEHYLPTKKVRTYTADDYRAFRKRVQRRRARKGYK